MKKMKIKKERKEGIKEETNIFKKIWEFIWKKDSVLSFILELVIAFIIIKFIFYPLLGIVLGTKFPIVAVVSNSMEHRGMNFEEWWKENKEFYEQYEITEEEFRDFKMPNGFNRGDLIILVGINQEDLRVGDIAVYWTQKKYPIIHRIIDVYEEDSNRFISTKGDNNPGMIIEPPIINEKKVSMEKLVGKAYFKIPYLGYVKIIFSSFIELFI